MTIPHFQSLMRPVLAHLGDGQVLRSRAVKDSIVKEFALTLEGAGPDDPEGRQRVVDNRVSWALTYLAQAGLIERPVRGQVKFTPQGRAALTDHPERIDMRVLENYPGYRAFKERTKAVADAPSGVETAQDPTATPQELVQAAVSQNRAALEAEVLHRALALSPTGFEDLVMVLLEKMGYGRLGTIARTSASGDAGVDALLGKQGDRGVLITTSSFTTGALSEAERINARIELIDGALLAELVVRYEVGVQVEQRVAL